MIATGPRRSHAPSCRAPSVLSPPMDAIVVQDLRKRYGDVQALDGVSFAVREGEVFGLLGPNGAGKSTTVRTLVTLTKPDSGMASVAGHDVQREQNAVRRAIGYVPQDSGVDELGTGRENLMLQGRVQGMSGKDLRARTDELLELVGITDAADRIVKTYSGGMRRRLDIALGLVHRPRVLFLDEPTTGLDPEARVVMWEEVSRLARAESLTILLTTHYLEEADQLADRLAIVSQGKVVVEGTPGELKAGLRGDAVHVEVEGDTVAEAQRVLTTVGAAPEQVLEGRTIVTRVENGGRALPGIISALETAGITVASVSLSRPSLDDVYLHFTGREFASEDRAA
jgi:ABC-2 type transport system ATP-binding protein